MLLKITTSFLSIVDHSTVNTTQLKQMALDFTRWHRRWLGDDDWETMIGRRWLGDDDWETMIGRRWLGDDDWETMIGRRWIGDDDWETMIGRRWLGDDDWETMIWPSWPTQSEGFAHFTWLREPWYDNNKSSLSVGYYL